MDICVVSVNTLDFSESNCIDVHSVRIYETHKVNIATPGAWRVCGRRAEGGLSARGECVLAVMARVIGWCVTRMGA